VLALQYKPENAGFAEKNGSFCSRPHSTRVRRARNYAGFNGIIYFLAGFDAPFYRPLDHRL
jgi:hypothetical protein